jgi:pimeloyl-ACP methyl ester carboxylesterase
MNLRAHSVAVAVAVAAAVLVTGCAHPGPASPPVASLAAPAPAKERTTFVDGTAGRLRVSDGGTGEPAVILLHGLAADLEVWRGQLDHLRANRRVVAYDQRGHGGSEKARDGVYTMEALAADLEAVRRAMGLGRVILIGHSMSGAVLTTYAAAHPDTVAGLVYLEAIGDFHAVPPEAFQPVIEQEASPSFDASARRAALEGMLGPKARPATREAVLASSDRMDPPAFGALRRSMFALRDARARLAAYRGPSVAIEATENPYAESMAGQVLGIPLTRVSGVSHWLQLDDPDAVNRALDAFLAGLSVAR